MEISLPLADRLVEGTFERRLNRFAAEVRVAGEVISVHIPNSGRLGELLTSEAPCLLADPGDDATRKTRYDLAAVRYLGRWVSIDARLPGRLVARVLAAGGIKEFRGYDRIRAEAQRGQSRLDFRLEGAGLPPCWIEVKSVTLVVQGEARFPDAPTERGRKHLAELTAAVRAGERAAVLFVIQRDDAGRFAPNRVTDPDFAADLARAAEAGVEVAAYRCPVARDGIRWGDPIPVLL